MSFNTDCAVKQLRVKDKVLNFLRTNNLLQELEQNCKSFIRNNAAHRDCYAPFFVNLNLRFCEIEEGKQRKFLGTSKQYKVMSFSTADILYLVTREPKRFTTLAEEVIFCFLKSILRESGVNVTLAQEQVHCIVRFYDLPLISSYKFSLKATQVNCSLSTLRCVIVSKTLPEQYM